MKSTSGCVRILALSCTLYALLALCLPSSVLGQTTSADYLNRGNAKAANGDLDGAIADYNRAIELDPKLTDACYNRGNAKQAKGDLDGAIVDFTRTLELDPNYALAYYNRGVTKRARNDLDGAIADFTAVLELDPKDAGAYTTRGVAKSEKADLDGAMADYNRAIEVNPKYALAYFNRGNAKQAKGDLEGAKADYKRAIELDPKLASATPVFGGEIKVNDSDDPILQYFAVTLTPATADHPANIKINPPPLLTIRSIRNLIVQADGKQVTVVLNERDSKKFEELKRKFQRTSFCCQVSEKPFVGVFGSVSELTPNKDGIVEFSERRHSGNIVEYLRRRFGK